MPKIFSEQDKENLRVNLIEEGFDMLRCYGYDGVNIDELCRRCYIAKGTFYNFFDTKAEYIYNIMIYERERSKQKLTSLLDDVGQLDSSALREYLMWLRDENPNVFSYLSEKEQKRLAEKWPIGYLENKYNDEQTMRMLISLLKYPKENADWENACNLMKMLAISLAMPQIFIGSAFKSTTEILIDCIVGCLAEK